MAIYKDENGTYFVKYKINGVSKTKRGFKLKSEAKLWYDEQKQLDRNGDLVINHISFEKCALEYLNNLKTRVEYGTYQKNKHIVEAHINPYINIKKNIDKFTEKDCFNYWNCINGMDYKTEYKNNILGVFKEIFRYGKKFGYLKKDTTYVMDRFRKTITENREARERENKVWEIDDFQRFISCVNAEPYRTLYILLFFTGLRKNEALALTWNDFKGSTLIIDKSLTKKTELTGYAIKEPKNKYSVRNIALNKELIRILENHHNREMSIPGYSDDWFIFGRLHPLADNTIKRVKDRAIKESGVKQINIHQFRHSHASNLINSGMNIVAVSRRLGHSSVDTTLKIYTHLLQNPQLELLSKLEADMSSIAL